MILGALIIRRELLGWNQLSPGGETKCAFGGDYIFHVRPGSSEKLLIFFNGGGACWTGSTCNPEDPTFVPAADLQPNDPAMRGGVFNLEDEENPFGDYTTIFISYCTGDVHLGNRTAVYEIPATNEEPAREITVFHNGYQNAMSALNWVFANFESPETIFVAGSSAGSIASPFYAGIIAEQYPYSRIEQLGDGSGGYRAPEAIPVVNEAWNTLSILPDWPAYAGANINNLSFESYYAASAARHPDITFSQYNTAFDATQIEFLALLGKTDVSLLDLIQANYEDIRNEVPEFYTYTAGGSVHTILRRPEFYEYVVDGVRVRDWVAALAQGETVQDVLCTNCSSPPDTVTAIDDDDGSCFISAASSGNFSVAWLLGFFLASTVCFICKRRLLSR